MNVVVSGCFDILHGGHVQFLEDARTLGTSLTVCVAKDEWLEQYKGRRPAMPAWHKVRLLEALRCVDVAWPIASDKEFEAYLQTHAPCILAATEDDAHAPAKRALCERLGCLYVQISKRLPGGIPTSTTKIREALRAQP